MSLIKGIYTIVLFSISSISWGFINPFDLTISERDLVKSGIIQDIWGPKGPNTRSKKQSQEIVIRHVLSTGQDRANKQQYLFVNIKTLEQINPKFKAFNILRTAKQNPLTNEQVYSLSKQLRNQHLPQWLLNKRQKIYIHAVLQEKNCPNCPIRVISTENSRRLVNWAIKNKRLSTGDHPQ
jgi:hypothetical protein